MIAILSSNLRERVVLGALCENQGWPAIMCESVRLLKRALLHTRPRVILTRHKLHDGYSDDVISWLDNTGQRDAIKIIVLVNAGVTAAEEARQILLGADVVQRDPLRIDVVTAYLSRFRVDRVKLSARLTPAGPVIQSFAGTSIQVVDRTVRRAGKSVDLTPREMELIQVLHESPGAIVTHETLYEEILGRRFHGDTSNLRVLLAKLAKSFRTVGGQLRHYIEVIPKTGLRYRPDSPPRCKLAPG